MVICQIILDRYLVAWHYFTGHQTRRLDLVIIFVAGKSHGATTGVRTTTQRFWVQPRSIVSFGLFMCTMRLFIVFLVDARYNINHKMRALLVEGELSRNGRVFTTRKHVIVP